MSGPLIHAESARLLVVDDDPLMCAFAVENLTTSLVSVESACNGDEAWHILRKTLFDITIIDLEMPVMNGFELIGLIRGDEQMKHMPVVVATSSNDMDAVDRAFAAGATAFIIKPVNWRVISHQISYVLRAAREQDLVRKALEDVRNGVIIRDEVNRQALARLERIAGRAGMGQERSASRLSQDLQGLIRDLKTALSLAG